MVAMTVQDKMLEVLSDGQEHEDKELHGCLADELGPMTNILAHLTAIRNKIHPAHDVALVRHSGRTFYKIVRKLASPYDGRS